MTMHYDFEIVEREHRDSMHKTNSRYPFDVGHSQEQKIHKIESFVDGEDPARKILYTGYEKNQNGTTIGEHWHIHVVTVNRACLIERKLCTLD
jgi:hypothetical protein